MPNYGTAERKICRGLLAVDIELKDGIEADENQVFLVAGGVLILGGGM